MENFKALVISVLFIALMGCMDVSEKQDGPTPPVKENYREFATIQACAVSVDYHTDGCQIPFELFDRNPFVEVGEMTYEKIAEEPLFRGYTDAKGHFSGEVTLPAVVTEVWLSSDATGAVGSVRLSVKNSSIAFDQQDYLLSKTTKASTSDGLSYPDGYKILGTWDAAYGTPSYLSAPAVLPGAFINSVDKLFTNVVHEKLSVLHPELLEDPSTRELLILSEPTKIKMAFMRSGASLLNVLCYYTYPTGTTPSADELTKIIAFPNVTKYFRMGAEEQVGALLTGDQIQLKYWDGTKFEEEFPAGTSIGFCLMTHGFSKGNIKIYPSFPTLRYSNPLFNPQVDDKYMQRSVALRDPATGLIAIGFEDNVDWNFSDAVFAIDVENQNALGEMQGLPSAPAKEVYTEYRGSLAFEDIWPYAGDYDMNDVVIYYTSRVYQNAQNQVTKTVDSFTVKNNGAALTNGFGYQMHKVLPAQIAKVVYESDMPASKFMQGASLEQGQAHPTMILFDDTEQALGKTYTVTTTFNAGVDYRNVVPPYNPFIITNSDRDRGQEVHLSNYPPTSLVNESLLGTGKDVSRPELGIYYVLEDNIFPFAMHIAGHDFVYPPEGVRIDIAYPDFMSWVVSKQPSDWYLRPRQ